jgi:hypothetical protein
MIAQIKMINTNYTFVGTDSSPEKGMISGNSTILSKLHKRINNQSSGDKTPV